MIKYSKEEFPARFTVFKHTCKYCGTTFYSNRKKGDYDTGTCRTYAWKKKHAKAEIMASGGIVPKKKNNAPEEVKSTIKPVLFIPYNSDGAALGDREWSNYFPEIVWDDVWEGKIRYGSNDRYSFSVHESTFDKSKENGIYIELRFR